MPGHTGQQTPEQVLADSPDHPADQARHGHARHAATGQADQAFPVPQPRDDLYGEQWGPTPTPIQEPEPLPKGAKPGVLMIVGVVVAVALVALIVALVRS